jgi:hypothetical protein
MNWTNRDGVREVPRAQNLILTWSSSGSDREVVTVFAISVPKRGSRGLGCTAMLRARQRRPIHGTFVGAVGSSRERNLAGPSPRSPRADELLTSLREHDERSRHRHRLHSIRHPSVEQRRFPLSFRLLHRLRLSARFAVLLAESHRSVSLSNLSNPMSPAGVRRLPGLAPEE